MPRRKQAKRRNRNKKKKKKAPHHRKKKRPKNYRAPITANNITKFNVGNKENIPHQSFKQRKLSTNKPHIPPNQSIPHDCSTLNCSIFGAANSHRKETKPTDPFDVFIQPLTVDYKPILSLSIAQKNEKIKQIMNTMDQDDTSTLYDLLTIVSSVDVDEHDTKSLLENIQLHNNILIQLATNHIRIYDDNHHITHILKALNHCNMVLYGNNSSRSSASHLRATCLYKLGINIMDKTELPSILQDNENKSDDGLNMEINRELWRTMNQYQHVLLKYSKYQMNDTDMIRSICCRNYKQISWEVIFVSVADLMRTKQWELEDLFQFLMDIEAQTNLIEKWTENNSFDFDIDVFPCCVIVLSSVLNWTPNQINQCFTVIAHGLEFGMDFIDFLQRIRGSDWFRDDGFIYTLGTIHVARFDFNDLLQLRHPNKIGLAYFRHQAWMVFFAVIKQITGHFMPSAEYIHFMPSNGKARNLYQEVRTKLDYISCLYYNHHECAENIDFMFIHAAAMALNEVDVLKEITNKNMRLHLFYDQNITFLHYFALNGCAETVKFVVNHGVNVNCMVDEFNINLTYDQFYGHQKPMTALDFCYYGLEMLENTTLQHEDILQLFLSDPDDRKCAIELGVSALKEFGAKTAREILGDKECDERIQKLKDFYQMRERIESGDSDDSSYVIPEDSDASLPFLSCNPSLGNRYGLSDGVI